MTSEWTEALAECDTLDKFNNLAVAVARERLLRDKNDSFARAVASEAKRRGYVYVGEKGTGSYEACSPEEYNAMMAELDRREKRELKRRLYRKTRATKVKFVHAAWMEEREDIGVMVLLDFRVKDKRSASEFEDVPRRVFESLFQKGADLALRNLRTMFTDVLDAKVPDYREAG